MFYSKEEIQELTGSLTHEIFEEVSEGVKKKYKQIKSKLPDFPYSYKEMLYAVQTVRSRAFGKVYGSGKTIVPFADLCNYG